MSAAPLPASFLDDINDGTDLPLAEQPRTLAVRLYDYQRRALHFMISREVPQAAADGFIRGGILADEQGLGKTVMCAALVASHRSHLTAPLATNSAVPCGATLICCTTPIQRQWCHELAQHAPELRIVTYSGRPTDASEVSILRDVERLAAADVVLTTYDVLMHELRPMIQAFESDKERRASLGLRVRAQDSAEKPSPLKYLVFWRMILDEVQKAPGSYKAGRTARLVRAVNRWAVSGTPMEMHQPDEDVGHLLNFLETKSSAAEQRQGPSSAHGTAPPPSTTQMAAAPARRVRCRSSCARSSSAAPSSRSSGSRPRTSRVSRRSGRGGTLALSPAEAVLYDEFVLPAAIRLHTKATAAAAAAAEASSSSSAEAGGNVLANKMILMEQMQRALLSP